MYSRWPTLSGSGQSNQRNQLRCLILLKTIADSSHYIRLKIQKQERPFNRLNGLFIEYGYIPCLVAGILIGSFIRRAHDQRIYLPLGDRAQVKMRVDDAGYFNRCMVAKGGS